LPAMRRARRGGQRALVGPASTFVLVDSPRRAHHFRLGQPHVCGRALISGGSGDAPARLRRNGPLQEACGHAWAAYLDLMPPRGRRLRQPHGPSHRAGHAMPNSVGRGPRMGWRLLLSGVGEAKRPLLVGRTILSFLLVSELPGRFESADAAHVLRLLLRRGLLDLRRGPPGRKHLRSDDFMSAGRWRDGRGLSRRERRELRHGGRWRGTDLRSHERGSRRPPGDPLRRRFVLERLHVQRSRCADL